MNRVIKIAICILLAVLTVSSAFISCQKQEEPTFESSDIKINESFIPSDGSVPLMNADNCLSLLTNPDRGLRMEAYITLGETPDTYPLSGEDPFEEAKKTIEYYKEDSPTLCQLYVYLSNYRKKDLDAAAFSNLTKILQLYKDANIRLLLRFAYSTESVKDAPYRIVKRHLEQIKTYFNENESLINDTLYCLQTGIIGYWGEGHSNKKLKNRYIDDVIEQVCNLAPDGIYTQVRTFDMLCKVTSENQSKVGIHDDYIIGDLSHKWAFIPSTSQQYEAVMLRSKLTVNDGEMPWGRAKKDDLPDGEPLNSLDGKAILAQLSAYSLTSFSLSHNYIEDGNENSMAKWKKVYLSYDEALNLGINVNPELFKNANGNSVTLSVYNIVRYHLGYQLVLSNYKNSGDRVSFTVTNYGFAAPLNFNYFALVLKDKKTGKAIEQEIEEYDKTQLQSGTSVKYDLTIPHGYEAVGVKMDTFKGRNINPIFANSTKYKDGIQYFK